MSNAVQNVNDFLAVHKTNASANVCTTECFEGEEFSLTVADLRAVLRELDLAHDFIRNTANNMLKMIKVENDEWVSDNNGNKCGIEYFGSLKTAKLALSTLINCTDCVNCIGCLDCVACVNCYNCSGCENCKNCTDCTGCTGCVDCSWCHQCRDIQSAVRRVLICKGQ